MNEEDVPLHATMLLRIPGKVPDTVLTVEAMIYTWRICEYTEPLSYGRHWCYEQLPACILALLTYIKDDTDEPAGWRRAHDHRGTRRRLLSYEVDEP